jgi:16S rRNA (guanine1207-N2)-methyltransferase
LEEQADGAFERMTVLAPPGVLERRYVLAHALRLLSPGGRLIALAPKDRGGARLARELAAFGCTTEDSARRHHRFCSTVRPQKPEALEAAIAAGGPQIAPALGLWTQPGVFSWDRPDPGSRLLIDQLPQLSGVGADLGCGIGLLAGAALQSPTVQRLTLTDIDRRAIEAARRNIQDMRASFVWGDARAEANGLRDLDFVVMNPPFHEQGWEDRGLGASFIRSAAAGLKPKGVCWMVANRHLPYEAVIAPLFPRARQVAQVEGYKVYEARR